MTQGTQMQINAEIMDGLVETINQAITKKFKAVAEARRLETVNIVRQMAESEVLKYTIPHEKHIRRLIKDLVQSEVRIAVQQIAPQKSAKAVAKEPVFVDASAKVKAAAKTKVATPGYTKASTTRKKAAKPVLIGAAK
jgi:hypothetical protein